jgi:hypothetical protein
MIMYPQIDSIMTDDNYINTDVSIGISTADTYIDDIMTEDIQTRNIGKPKADKDPNALKLASFRTKEGIWAEFCQKAESINLTATDVLKAAMDQFIAGEYDPRVYVPSRHNDNGLTREDVMTLINTAINTSPDTSEIEQLVKAQIEPLADLLTELETYTQNQFKAVREELKKPLAIV